jgi:hypothetical protein
VPDRCLPPPAAGQPLAGQAGPEPERPELDRREPDWPELDWPELDWPELDWPEPPPRIGGADRAGPRAAEPRERAGVRDAPVPPVVTAGPGDAALARGAAEPAAAERPAPRDQPEAVPADPPDPPALGGKSSGGATRPAPLSASGMFRRATLELPAPATTRRLVLASPSPSADGEASGRTRDA